MTLHADESPDHLLMALVQASTASVGMEDLFNLSAMLGQEVARLPESERGEMCSRMRERAGELAGENRKVIRILINSILTQLERSREWRLIETPMEVGPDL